MSEHHRARAQIMADILQLDDVESVSSAQQARSKPAYFALISHINALYSLPEHVEAAVCAYFSARYLPALFRAYKATPKYSLVTPYTQMFSVLMDKGHFARFLRTDEGKEMLGLQTARFAGEDYGDDLLLEDDLLKDIDEIWNAVQIFNFLVVYAYNNNNRVSPVIPPVQSKMIQKKCEAYRHLCYTNLPDEAAERTFQSLTFCQEFLTGERSPKDMLGAVGLMMPLATCGDESSGCWRTGEVPKHACSRCQSVFYCGVEHQKAHWKTHKVCCVRPEWV